MSVKYLESGAIFSPDGKYRYELHRKWGEGPILNSIGLNPSRAGNENDDPTIRREVGFAMGWGYGALYKYNLFAFISSDPKALCSNPDPIGPDNNGYLKNLKGDVLICWGSWNMSFIWMRAALVKQILKNPYCLGRNPDGEPKHPLYLPSTTKLERY